MNFSNKNTSEELLTKENIFKYISAFDVFNYYVPGIQLGRTYKSPLRTDNNPSFGIFVNGTGELIYNDFRLGGGDCFKLVALIEGLSYYGAMNFVNQLFGLNLVSLKGSSERIEIKERPEITKKQLKKRRKPKISIKSRDWSHHDEEYFSPLDCGKLDMIPIEYFWLDEQLFGTSRLAYAYRYAPHIYKIYQPEKDVKNGKWWSNISNKVDWFGHHKLPATGDLLFVCSSNKDASVLHQLGYHAIAPHTEAQIFSAAQYEDYSKRFKRIVIFYDNDEAGIEYAVKFQKAYGFEYIFLEEVDTKDPFLFIKKYNLNELDKWLKLHLLKE